MLNSNRLNKLTIITNLLVVTTNVLLLTNIYKENKRLKNQKRLEDMFYNTYKNEFRFLENEIE